MRLERRASVCHSHLVSKRDGPSLARVAAVILALGLLIAIWTGLDSESFVAAVVALAVSVPVISVAIVLLDHLSRSSFCCAVALLCTVVVMVPLSVGGRFPPSGGGGRRPGVVGLVFLGLVVFGLGWGLGAFSWTRQKSSHEV